MEEKLQDLYEKLNEIVEEMSEFLTAHKDEEEMTEEEVETYNRMEKRRAAINAKIARVTELVKEEQRMSAPMSCGVVLNNPQENKFVYGVRGTKDRRASNEYKAAMIDALRTNFKNVRNELKTSVDSAGGYLVPSEWDAQLTTKLAEENVMRSLSTVITTSGEHKIPVVADKPAASWVEEGEALTFGNASFAQKTLDAHKLHVAIKITNELLFDNAFNLESYIIEEFARAISNAEEEAFLNGDGEGKPTGVFVTAAEAENEPLTTAGASISGDDIINLVYALKRPYRKNAAFILNDSTLALVRKLKDGNQAYLWQPSYQAGEPDRLFGYPVYTTAYAPVAESGKAIIAFGDYSYYKIGDRGTRAIQELKELFAGNDMTGYLMKERVDGVLTLPEAVKVLKLK